MKTTILPAVDKLLQEERKLHNTNPRKVVELAGVPSLDFWEFEEDISEADFEVRNELKEELEKVSQNLISVLVKQEEKEMVTRQTRRVERRGERRREEAVFADQVAGGLPKEWEPLDRSALGGSLRSWQ